MTNKDKILIYGDYELEGSFKDSLDPKKIYPFSNIFIEVNKNSNPRKITLLEKEAITALVAILKNTSFNVLYSIDWPQTNLPTGTELTNLYNGAGIPAVEIATGKIVTLQKTSHPVKQLDGALVTSQTGLFEVAGYDGIKWVIDTLSSSIQKEIDNIILRLDVLEAKELDNKAVIDKNKQDLTILKPLVSANTTKSNQNATDITTNKTNIATNKTDITADKQAISSLNNSQGIQDTEIETLRENVDLINQVMASFEIEDNNKHTLSGDANNATFDISTIVTPSKPFSFVDGKKFTLGIKDPARNIGGSSEFTVGGTPQTISLAHGGGASESYTVAIDNAGIFTLHKTAGSTGANTIVLEHILQTIPKGSIDPQVQKNKADIAINKTTIGQVKSVSDKNTTDLTKKQDQVDNNLTTTSKHIVGAINELNAKPQGLKKPNPGESGPDFFKRLAVGDRVYLDNTQVSYYGHPVIATITFKSATDLRADGTLSQDSDDYDNIEMTAKSNQDWKWNASLSWGGKIENGYPKLPLDEFPAAQGDVKAYVTNAIKDIKDHDIKSLQDKDVMNSKGKMVDLSSMVETGTGTDLDKVLITAELVYKLGQEYALTNLTNVMVPTINADKNIQTKSDGSLEYVDKLKWKDITSTYRTRTWTSDDNLKPIEISIRQNEHMMAHLHQTGATMQLTSDTDKYYIWNFGSDVVHKKSYSDTKIDSSLSVFEFRIKE